MRVTLQRPAHAIVGEFGHRRWQTKVGLLLHDQIVDDLVLPLELDLDALQLGAEPSVLVFEVVGGHALLHDVFVEALTLLVDHSGAQLADLEVDLAVRLDSVWQAWCLLGQMNLIWG